jgi:hypothetical protein
MNIALYVQRVELPRKKGGLSFGRRVRNISEIIEHNNYVSVAEWNPTNDTFKSNFNESYLLKNISQKNGVPLKNILKEIDKREKFINDIVKSGVKDQKLIAEKILSYYNEQRKKKDASKKKSSKKKKIADKKLDSTDYVVEDSVEAIQE